MTTSLIGSISLNISFILYLILYIPQIIHNRKSTNIAQLSLNLHLLLYSSYFFDLCYGFSSHLPWQYKTVSIIGLSLVGIQHIQLMRFFIINKHLFIAGLSAVFLVLNVIAIDYFFEMKHGLLATQTTLLFGAIARLTGLVYCLPQIIKNITSKSANALSLHFLYLNLMLALLDTISSWCLNWGWPNKLAAPVNIVMMLIMITQIKQYNDAPQSANRLVPHQH